jgi:hypothetical protein
MYFFNKPKFKFYSSVPGVTEMFPIIPATANRPSWMKSAVDAYKQKTSTISNFGVQLSSVSKCPGIHELGKLGWIVTSWFDFIIEANNRETASWKVPSTLPGAISQAIPPGDLIKFMNMGFPELSIPLPEYTSKLLVKITMPWVVDIPPGWNLLMIPTPYSGETRFQCSTGMLKSASLVEVNPQLFWNYTKGETLIKAGTPLCQLIPIPDSSFNANGECLEATAEIKKRQESFFYRKGCTFTRNPNVL